MLPQNDISLLKVKTLSLAFIHIYLAYFSRGNVSAITKHHLDKYSVEMPVVQYSIIVRLGDEYMR